MATDGWLMCGQRTKRTTCVHTGINLFQDESLTTGYRPTRYQIKLFRYLSIFKAYRSQPTAHNLSTGSAGN